MSIGQRVKQARKEAHMTQAELAKRTNLSRSYIGDIEIDRYNPSINTLEAIAKAVGVPTSQLVGGEIPTLNLDPSRGFFQNLGITKDTAPTSSGLTAKEERDIESDLEDMMNSMASAAYEGDKDNEEDIEILKATLKAAMMQAKKIAKKKYTPKKYRRD